jgi:colicin import membrane protein
VDKARPDVEKRLLEPKLKEALKPGGYVELQQRAVAAGFKAEVLRQTEKDQRALADKLASDQKQTSAELQQQRVELDTIEAKLKAPDLKDDAKKQAEEEKAKLEQEITAKEKQLKDAETAQQKATDAAKDAAKDAQAADDAKSDAQQRAKEAGETIFHGV